MARARWVNPAARRDHSWAGMIRGTRSSGNGRWSPATPKVSPLEAASSPMPVDLAASSSLVMASIASKTRRYGGRRRAGHRQGFVTDAGRIVLGAAQGSGSGVQVAGGLLHQKLDHVGHASSLGVADPLTRGRAAPRERGVGQVVHCVPVAVRLQLRPEQGQQLFDHDGGRLGPGGRPRAEQLPSQSAASSPPHGGPLDRQWPVREGSAGLFVLGAERDCRPEQPGDEDSVVDQRAGVAGAQFQCGDVTGGPDVEVDHFGVADHAGLRRGR